MEDSFVPPPRHDEERRDDVAAAPATPDPTPDDAATMPRHLYTMTVEDVGQMLNEHGVPRDERTIQRWCKAGKVLAIVDTENADRYLIEPSSIRSVVATLVEERRRQDERVGAVSRPEPTRRDNAATTHNPSFNDRPDTAPNVGDIPSDAATTSAESRDSVAALRERVAKLEEQNISLKIDKQSRDQVIAMIREQYEKMTDHALDRSERVGALEAENRQLKQLLPAQSDPVPESQQSFFTPDFSHRHEWRDDYPQGDNHEGGNRSAV